MRDIILKFSKKKFVRNVATVATGTIAVQAITVAFSPFITRIYGPEAFGVLGVFVSLISIITPISTLTYSTAIVLPAENKEAIDIAKLSLFVGSIISLIAALMILVFKNKIIEILQLQSISSYVYILPLVIFFAASTQVYNQWLIRENKYKGIARVSIIQALIVNLSKIGIGFWYSTATVLIGLASLGHFMHAQMFSAISGKEIRKQLKFKEIFSKEARLSYKKVGKKFKDFPYYRAPQMLFSAFSLSVPVLLLAHFFGPSAAGFYSLGRRVLNMPASIIGKSIGNVYYPRIAVAENKGEKLRPYIFKATLGMAVLCFLPVFVIMIIGPWLFGFVFGEQWSIAGHYSRWLSFLIFFEFILNPSKDAIIVMGLQKVLLLFEIISLAVKVGALTVGFSMFKNDLTSIILFSMAGASVAIIFMLFIFIKADLVKQVD